MKSLRGYIVLGTLVLLTLALVACSKKETNGGGQACPTGYTQQNGYCAYNGGNTGGGGNGGYGTPTPGSGIYYGKNGHIVDSGKFEGFNLRLVPPSLNLSKYWCSGGRYLPTMYGYIYIDCDDAYVALLKNGTNYYVQVSSSSLYMNTVALAATKFGGSTAAQSVFEIYHANPVNFKIAELVIYGDLATATSVTYSLNYFTNTGTSYQIVTGTMYKGYDY